MASLATEVGEDTGVLEDPISFEPYKAPTRILPCGHTLNHDSLVDLLDTANIDDEGNQYFECPVDRQRFSVKSADEFPRNFQLEQQIEDIKEQRGSMERRLKERVEMSLEEQEDLLRTQTETQRNRASKPSQLSRESKHNEI